jgi:glucoamylase
MKAFLSVLVLCVIFCVSMTCGQRLRSIKKVNAQCSVSKKVDCGYYGINQNQCESKGCCWVPNVPSTEPWCYNPASGPSPSPSPPPSPPSPSPSGNAPFTADQMKLMQGYFEANLNVHGNGAVMASPSTQSPDYYYHWQRDGAISMSKLFDYKMPVEYQGFMESYINWVHRAQFANDPNGIDIRGEPKFYVDGKCYEKGWMRPQRDGMALRTITLLLWAKELLSENKTDYVKQNIYVMNPNMAGVQRDLERIQQVWSQNSGDPWEEINSQVFFVKFVMRRALFLGAQIATALGDTSSASSYASTAKSIEDNINSNHWDANKGLIMEIPNQRPLDSAVHLGVLYGNNGDGFYSPSSERVQSSVAVLMNTFSSNNYPDFSINKKDDELGLPGLLVGRYPNDVYNGGNTSQPSGGNPWILCSSSLAEIFYTAAKEHIEAGVPLHISDVNIEFFKLSLEHSQHVLNSTTVVELRRKLVPGQNLDRSLFQNMMRALMATGDGILTRVAHHVKPYNFHLNEQINKDTGLAQGAHDLTWSYGTVIGAMKAREDLLDTANWIA